MNKLLDNMMKFLNETDEMTKEQQELIRYGLELLILKGIFILSTVIIGLFLGCISKCIIFLILFIPIRSTAGGYHARTRTHCFFLSVFTVILTIEVQRLMEQQPQIYILILVTSIIFGIVLWIASPVEHKNKPLTYNEKIQARKKLRVNMCIESILSLLLLYMKYPAVMSLMSICIIITGILSIIGYKKNSIYPN